MKDDLHVASATSKTYTLTKSLHSKWNHTSLHCYGGGHVRLHIFIQTSQKLQRDKRQFLQQSLATEQVLNKSNFSYFDSGNYNKISLQS